MCLCCVLCVKCHLVFIFASRNNTIHYFCQSSVNYFCLGQKWLLLYDNFPAGTKRVLKQMKFVIVVSCIISHPAGFGLPGHSKVCRADWVWRSYFFFFFFLDLIVNPYLNTNMSHLGGLWWKTAGPPCNANPLSLSGKSLSERSFMDFPKADSRKKENPSRGARFLFWRRIFFTILAALGNNYSDTAPPVVESRRATHSQHGPQREQLLRASPVSAVQVLPFLQDVLLPLETGLAVAHPAGKEGGREGGGEEEERRSGLASVSVTQARGNPSKQSQLVPVQQQQWVSEWVGRKK